MKTLIYFFVAFILTSCYRGDTADLIIHNAKIYSCDENFTVYEAMAIRDGKIIQLGPEREILNGYRCDAVIDAKMQPVYPGFHDGHCHFLGYAIGLSEVDLTGSTSFEEVLTRMEKYEETNELDWIKGRGWDQNLWETDSFPTNEKLNELFPDKPVLIRRVDGHAALANQKALDLAKFTTETVIDGGFIGVSGNKLTGLVLDNAYDVVARAMPSLNNDEKLHYLKQAEYNLFQEGLTSINDAGLTHEDRELFIDWYSNNELTIKSYAMLFPDNENMKFAREKGVYDNGKLTIRSFKVIADGALGSRGACLLAAYTDRPKQFGFLLRDTVELREIVELAAELGYQVNTHCIGDSANRVMLNLYASAIQNNPDHRWKIEHAQVVDSIDFDYFEAVHIIPSVQPTHCTSDMAWAEKRLGKERIKYAYAYKTLLEKTGMLVLGTDFPVENISALATFYAAITRMDKKGNPAGGFYPEERLSREEALKGMTIWPAFSNFQENQKGSLEEGKDADFIVLTKDIMTIEPKDILTTFVSKTYVNGELVYDGE